MSPTPLFFWGRSCRAGEETSDWVRMIPSQTEPVDDLPSFLDYHSSTSDNATEG